MNAGIYVKRYAGGPPEFLFFAFFWGEREKMSARRKDCMLQKWSNLLKLKYKYEKKICKTDKRRMANEESVSKYDRWQRRFFLF